MPCVSARSLRPRLRQGSGSGSDSDTQRCEQEIQAFVGEMQAQTVSTQSFDDEQLREMGMEVTMDASGKPTVRKKNPDA